MTDEECLIKISAEISGFEQEEDAKGLYDKLEKVKEIIFDWRLEKETAKVLHIKVK